MPLQLKIKTLRHFIFLAAIFSADSFAQENSQPQAVTNPEAKSDFPQPIKLLPTSIPFASKYF